jgi:hypothetical protein
MFSRIFLIPVPTITQVIGIPTLNDAEIKNMNLSEFDADQMQDTVYLHVYFKLHYLLRIRV